MEKIPKLEQIEPKTLFKAMKLSYQNAEEYCYEANLLYDLRKYGHSLSLSSLGLEELGKSFAFHLLLYMKIGVIKKHDNVDSFIRIIHQNHFKKQELSTISFIYSKSVMSLVYQIIDLNKKKIPDSNDINFLIKNFLKNNKLIIKKIEKYNKDFILIKELNQKKMNGMYVGITEANNIISNPKQIKAKDAKKVLEILEKYLDETYYLGSMSWTKKDNAEIERLQKYFNKIK